MIKNDSGALAPECEVAGADLSDSALAAAVACCEKSRQAMNAGNLNGDDSDALVDAALNAEEALAKLPVATAEELEEKLRCLMEIAKERRGDGDWSIEGASVLDALEFHFAEFPSRPVSR